MANKKTIIFIVLIAVVVIVGVVLAPYPKNNEKKVVEEKMKLADNEMSEGMIVFTVPEGYDCKVSDWYDGEDTIGYLLYSNETYLYYGSLYTRYDVNTSPANFDNYWEKAINDDAKGFDMEYVDEGMIIVNGNECHYRVAKYLREDIYIYYRVYLIFDERTGKVCSVNLYDNNSNEDYVDELLEGIRFI